MAATLDDFEVTPAMRRYLAAFDRYLRARTDDDVQAATADRLAALRVLRDDQRERHRHGLSDFDAEKLREAIGRRAGRRTRLTRRETQVLRLRCEGLTFPAIAALLAISVNTVRRHCDSIAAKAGTGNAFRLALWAVREGLVKPWQSRSTPR
jgi:DNA-binding NarL/FixJ family response regulator